MKKDIQIKTRSFGLSREDCDTKQKLDFYKTALKAYLKGKRRFRYGYKNTINGRVPAWFNTPIK